MSDSRYSIDVSVVSIRERLTPKAMMPKARMGGSGISQSRVWMSCVEIMFGHLTEDGGPGTEAISSLLRSSVAGLRSLQLHLIELLRVHAVHVPVHRDDEGQADGGFGRGDDEDEGRENQPGR